MAIWLCDTDGKNAKELIKSERILVPSWVPDSKHIVWMDAGPGQKKQDPASNSQIRIMNTETGDKMSHTDADRIAFNKATKARAYRNAIAKWLKANPDVGVLNGDKYYRTINGQTVTAHPAQESEGVFNALCMNA